MTKKIENNLQGSKKSSTFATGNQKQVFFEICSAQPCKAFKPHEAMSIRDMLIRTQRGQRLDVDVRFREEGIPDNMYKAEFETRKDTFGNDVQVMKPDTEEDTFDHTPPDGLQDIVDVIRYQEDLNERKEELKRKRQKREEESKPNLRTPTSDTNKLSEETKKDE